MAHESYSLDLWETVTKGFFLYGFDMTEIQKIINSRQPGTDTAKKMTPLYCFPRGAGILNVGPVHST